MHDKLVFSHYLHCTAYQCWRPGFPKAIYSTGNTSRKNLLCHFFKFAFCQICVAIFWSQSFQHTPLRILVNSENGVHVFSGVLCRNAWNSAIHLFIIWFTDILDNLDIQTELQDCLYEYGFKDKWYRLELLACVVLHVLHSDCIKIYDEVM